MLCQCCERIPLDFHRSRLLAKEYDSKEGGLQSPVFAPLRIAHQPDFDALVTSARGGCELCSMFVDFIGYKMPQPWEGSLQRHLSFSVTYRYTPRYDLDYVKPNDRPGVHGFSLWQGAESIYSRCEWPMILYTNKGTPCRPVEAPWYPSLPRSTKPTR